MNPLEDFKKKVVEKKESVKHPLLVLESKVASCNEELAVCRGKYTAIKKLLDSVETDLINAKESKCRAEEALEVYRQTRILDSSVDDATLEEVIAYRVVMQECMEKIAHEPPLRYLTISDLET